MAVYVWWVFDNQFEWDAYNLVLWVHDGAVLFPNLELAVSLFYCTCKFQAYWKILELLWWSTFPINSLNPLFFECLDYDFES